MYNFIELRELVIVLLKRWWFLLLAAMLGGALGYGISLRQTPIYEATTSLLVGLSMQTSTLDRTDLQTGQQLAITYSNIVRRQPVLQGAIDALQLDMSWQSLRSRVKVSVIDQTQLLEISVDAESPELAEQIAAEVARQLILLTPAENAGGAGQETSQFVQQRLHDMEAKIAAEQAALQSAEAKLAALGSDGIGATALRSEIRDIEERLLNWDNVYTRLLEYTKNTRTSNQLAIIEPAQAKSTPVQPNPGLNLTVGAALFLALASALVLLLHFWDDRLKSVEDAARHLKLTVLGQLSAIKGDNSHDKLIAKAHVLSSTSEGYRLVRSKLQFLMADLPKKIIMVTSSAQGEGKSLTTANLAIAMAEAGMSVVIVDANLRRPMQHEIFQLANSEGLTELLYAPKLQLDHYLRPTQVMNLRVLTAGSLPAYPSGMLGSMQMKRLLQALSEQFDLVLCDGPEATEIADAAILAHQVTGALLVVQTGKMRRDRALEAINNLRQAGAHILGVILNQPTVVAPRNRKRVAQESLALPVPVDRPVRPESSASGARS
ncbi:MAG: polysaccharide biosynthesis tyrosine autokinase [Caldilinea sp. CFX5]|nr:polysaccharide biosynthesis tyrosine autokinase [Caldilinea sp. CFX5]